jgi:hypothetical protein
MRQLASPDKLIAKATPDVARDRIVVAMGAARFSLSRPEAMALTKEIIAAFDRLLADQIRATP